MGGVQRSSCKYSISLFNYLWGEINEEIGALLESYEKANLGAKAMVRGDSLRGETHQRAPGITRAVGGHQGPENARRGSASPG